MRQNTGLVWIDGPREARLLLNRPGCAATTQNLWLTDGGRFDGRSPGVNCGFGVPPSFQGVVQFRPRLQIQAPFGALFFCTCGLCCVGLNSAASADAADRAWAKELLRLDPVPPLKGHAGA